MVVGDVNSTVAGALAAVKLGIPVAHVEAGLRSFDRTMPEEINRIAHRRGVRRCCSPPSRRPTRTSPARAWPPRRVHFVGNVMIDTLFRYRERAAASTILDRLGLAPGRYAALTLHRPSNVDTPDALDRDPRARSRASRREIPVVFPVHPRTRQRLERARRPAARRCRGCVLVAPLPYLDFVQLMANARCVLTDSGGIQEETTALGVPCLTLRENTERPITVTRGHQPRGRRRSRGDLRGLARRRRGPLAGRRAARALGRQGGRAHRRRAPAGAGDRPPRRSGRDATIRRRSTSATQPSSGTPSCGPPRRQPVPPPRLEARRRGGLRPPRPLPDGDRGGGRSRACCPCSRCAGSSAAARWSPSRTRCTAGSARASDAAREALLDGGRRARAPASARATSSCATGPGQELALPTKSLYVTFARPISGLRRGEPRAPSRASSGG